MPKFLVEVESFRSVVVGKELTNDKSAPPQLPFPTARPPSTVQEMATSLARTSPVSKSPPQKYGVRYRCSFPGCCKRYASTDGVRKHARKMHLAWLRSVDETAGSRDTRLESKPSTYCVREEGYADDDVDVEEPSPTLTPTMTGLHLHSPPTSGGASPTGLTMMPPELSLPEPAVTTVPLGAGSSAAAHEVSTAMAAAAAAAMVNGGQPPLAWLLAQSAMAQAQTAMMAHQLATAQAALSEGQKPLVDMSPPVSLPVSLGGAAPPVPAPLPPWLQGGLSDPSALLPPPVLGGAADPRLAFDPLPAPTEWPAEFKGDLSSLFGPVRPPTNTSQATLGEESNGLPPLCLTPPQASALLPGCVSPFELDKRAAPPPNKSVGPEGGLLSKEDQMRLELSPTSTTFPFADDDVFVDDSLPAMKEDEYAAFVSTLLA